MFPGPAGKPWTERGWQNWRRRVWRPAAKAAGLAEGSRPRDLRASYASVLIRGGMTVVEVAHELGHSPQMCLRVYGRAFAEAPKRRVKPETAILNARKELARSLSVPSTVDGKASPERKRPAFAGPS